MDVETPLFTFRYSSPALPPLFALPPRAGTRSPETALQDGNRDSFRFPDANLTNFVNMEKCQCALWRCLPPDGAMPVGSARRASGVLWAPQGSEVRRVSSPLPYVPLSFPESTQAARKGVVSQFSSASQRGEPKFAWDAETPMYTCRYSSPA